MGKTDAMHNICGCPFGYPKKMSIACINGMLETICAHTEGNTSLLKDSKKDSIESIESSVSEVVDKEQLLLHDIYHAL